MLAFLAAQGPSSRKPGPHPPALPSTCPPPSCRRRTRHLTLRCPASTSLARALPGKAATSNPPSANLQLRPVIQRRHMASKPKPSCPMAAASLPKRPLSPTRPILSGSTTPCPPAQSPAPDGGDSWNWVSGNPAPFSGPYSRIRPATGRHRAPAFLTGPPPRWPSDRRRAAMPTSISIQPIRPPKSCSNGMTGPGNIARIGAPIASVGHSRHDRPPILGPLPATGQWVQLKVPASLVGLEGSIVNGMAFSALQRHGPPGMPPAC